MIREGGNRFTPGSIVPPEANIRVDTSTVMGLPAFTSGRKRNVLILGAPQTGKTTLGFNVLREAAERDPDLWVNYWTERDLFADQRNLWRMEDLAAKVTKDDGLWHEYLEWERLYHDLRETTLLFLDDVGVGYSPHHRYELEGLLRQRSAMGLGTVVAAQTDLWSELPKGLRALFENSCAIVQPARMA